MPIPFAEDDTRMDDFTSPNVHDRRERLWQGGSGTKAYVDLYPEDVRQRRRLFNAIYDVHRALTEGGADIPMSDMLVEYVESLAPIEGRTTVATSNLRHRYAPVGQPSAPPPMTEDEMQGRNREYYAQPLDPSVAPSTGMAPSVDYDALPPGWGPTRPQAPQSPQAQRQAFINYLFKAV